MREETLNKIKTEFEQQKQEFIAEGFDPANENYFLKLINNIRLQYAKDIEECNNELLLYFKSYYYSRTIADDVITVPYGAKNEDFRRYVNLETGTCTDVFKTDWEEFEAQDNVIIPEINIYTYDDFINRRSRFILDAVENGQEKAIQRVLKK